MESQKKQAWITSLKLMAATPKSRSELSKKLRDKGYEESVVSEVLDELERKGLLSDKAFANDIVSRLTHAKPSGKRRISFELKRRGIPTDLREEILTGLNEGGEAEKAQELAALKWESFKRFPLEKRKKRTYDFLARRGFDFQIIRDVVESLESKQDEN